MLEMFNRIKVFILLNAFHTVVIKLFSLIFEISAISMVKVKCFSVTSRIPRCPMAETPRHGDIVADRENVLQTAFV